MDVLSILYFEEYQSFIRQSSKMDFIGIKNMTKQTVRSRDRWNRRYRQCDMCPFGRRWPQGRRHLSPIGRRESTEWLAEIKNRGLDIGIAGGDVSSAEDAAAMMAKIQEDFGNVDILVNCAGITRDAMMKRMDVAKWDAVISTNLSSAFYVTKPVWDGMVERGYGRIINVPSMNGQRGQAGQANYASAKLACMASP